MHKNYSKDIGMIQRCVMLLLLVNVWAFGSQMLAAQQKANEGLGEGWRVRLHQSLPLLGHRNWILVVDSAYPLQTSPGVETIETDGSEVEVVREVLREVDQSIHIRPVLYMDAELPFVTENDAPGVEKYRREIRGVLGDRPFSSIPHEDALSKIDEAGKTFHVLVLKTRLAIPYTSVFIQLDCKYWSADAEARLRQAMKSHAQ
jgi:hypothetical protein